MLKKSLCAAGLATCFTAPAMAQQEIQWWHSMGGQLGEWVNDLAAATGGDGPRDRARTEGIPVR
jgi:ABC-type glycerol-3-phosphate transport system substrate-binding protein